MRQFEMAPISHRMISKSIPIGLDQNLLDGYGYDKDWDFGISGRSFSLSTLRSIYRDAGNCEPGREVQMKELLGNSIYRLVRPL